MGLFKKFRKDGENKSEEIRKIENMENSVDIETTNNIQKEQKENEIGSLQNQLKEKMRD